MKTKMIPIGNIDQEPVRIHSTEELGARPEDPPKEAEDDAVRSGRARRHGCSLHRGPGERKTHGKDRSGI